MMPSRSGCISALVLVLFNVAISPIAGSSIIDNSEGILPEITFPWLNDSCETEIIPGAGGWRVVCDAYDTVDDLPAYPDLVGRVIAGLVIRNQPRLTHLSRSRMALYPNLVDISITNSGLTWIEPNAFARNRRLKKVTLGSNALRTLDWRSVVNLRDAQLDIRDNPLVCNCSLFWLAAWKTETTKRRRFQSPDGTEFFISSAQSMTLPRDIVLLDELKCAALGQTAAVHLSTWRFMNRLESDREKLCSLPSISMQPKVTTIDQAPSSVHFECALDSNQQLDLEFRQVINTKVVDINETRSLMEVEKRISYSGRSTVTVRIPNASLGQMGWYVCVGSSVSGPNFDMAALAVRSKPHLALIFKNRTKSADYFTDTFKFNIFAFPPLTNISWLKNNAPINFTDEAHKHAFLVFNEESEQLHRKGFFFAFRTIFVARLRYSHRFFEGDYAMMACNPLSCNRITFVNYDKYSLPRGHVGVASGGGIMSPTGHLSGRQMADPSWIAVITCMVIGVCLCGGGAGYYYVRYKRQRPSSGRPLWAGSCGTEHGRLVGNGWTEGRSVELSSYTPNDAYEPYLSTVVALIPKESLEIVKTLGEGAFGEVYLVYCDLNTSTNQVKEKHQMQVPEKATPSTTAGPNIDRVLMAAKTLKRFSTDRSQEIAREAELMARLNHPNIVTFYGACFRGEEGLMLLYEYMELGDLREFLASHGPNPELHDVPLDQAWILNDTQLVDISRQVAQGLAHLHKHHFVHRDLACRNCLVKAPMVVKLSDFGMTRDIYSSDYYRLTHKAPLPVRWLPPESLLYGRFSNLSDIWSFGVVVWEICNYGQLPWCEYSNAEVMQRVNAGETLVPPENCPLVLRQIMLDSWKRAPSERIKVDEIVRRLGMS